MADVAAFQLRAREPSAIPWHPDDHEEMRLLAPMTAGPPVRGLALELRAQLAAHQERVLAAADQPGGRCPLHLRRLWLIYAAVIP